MVAAMERGGVAEIVSDDTDVDGRLRITRREP